MPRRDRYDRSDATLICPVCEGSGVVPDPDAPGYSMVCPMCDGHGRVTPAALGAYEATQE